MFHCVSIIRVRPNAETKRMSVTREDKGPLTLATMNQMIYDAFGIPNRSDIFTLAYLTDENVLDHVVIRDGRYV